MLKHKYNMLYLYITILLRLLILRKKYNISLFNYIIINIIPDLFLPLFFNFYNFLRVKKKRDIIYLFF